MEIQDHARTRVQPATVLAHVIGIDPDIIHVLNSCINSMQEE